MQDTTLFLEHFDVCLRVWKIQWSGFCCLIQKVYWCCRNIKRRISL